jgi:hypothetical protein
LNTGVSVDDFNINREGTIITIEKGTNGEAKRGCHSTITFICRYLCTSYLHNNLSKPPETRYEPSGENFAV